MSVFMSDKYYIAVLFFSFLFFVLKMAPEPTSASYQVVLPALGGVFWVPLLLWGAHWSIHIGRVSIAVARIISSAPASSSDSRELKPKRHEASDLQLRGKHHQLHQLGPKSE